MDDGSQSSPETTPTRDLKVRTKAFALRVIRLVKTVSRGRAEDVICRQLLRAAMSVGANYRAACRARSRAEFVAKMGIVEEELDECAYWLELIEESGLVARSRLKSLRTEADELLSITVQSIKTARRPRP